MVEVEPVVPVAVREEYIDDELSCGAREAWFGFSTLGLLRDSQPAMAPHAPALPARS
jgi:hypothetical protein